MSMSVIGDLDGLPITPVPTPNRDDIRSLPLGVQLVSVAWEGDNSPDISSQTLTEEYRQELVDNLDDEEQRYSVFLLHSPKPSEPQNAFDALIENAPSPDVMSPEKIYAEVLQSERRDDTLDTRHLVMAAIRLARQGLVQNPF